MDINIGTLLGQIDRDARVRLVLYEVHLAADHAGDRRTPDGNSRRTWLPQSAVSRASRRPRVEADEIDRRCAQAGDGILDQAHARANEIVADGKSDGVKERERQIAAATPRRLSRKPIALAKSFRGQVSAIAVASAEKILQTGNRQQCSRRHSEQAGG